MANSRFARVWAVCVLALSVGLAQGTAFAAASKTEAGARAVAWQGMKAYEAGSWSEAINLLSKAESLAHAPTHLLYMARAQAELGHLVAARALYRQIVDEKLAAGSPAAFVKAQEDAQSELETLEPRLATLTIGVEAPQGVTVTLIVNGYEVPSQILGVARDVDPGEYEIAARAEGHAAEPAKVLLEEGGRETVVLKLTPTQAAPATEPVPEPEPVLLTTDAPEPPPTGETGPNAMRVGAYVALGVGVVGLAAGTYFGIKWRKQRSDADDKEKAYTADCGDSCSSTDPEAVEIDQLNEDADKSRLRAAIGLAVGGVGLITGAVLFVVSGGSPQRQVHERHIQPWVGLGSVGLRGRF